MVGRVGGASSMFSFLFFFNDTATTEIYPLSLHDALPISNVVVLRKAATITDVPVEGSSPAFDATIGTSIVRYNLSGTSFIDTGLTNGTQYFYRVFAKDPSGNYSATGVEVSA